MVVICQNGKAKGKAVCQYPFATLVVYFANNQVEMLATFESVPKRKIVFERLPVKSQLFVDR